MANKTVSISEEHHKMLGRIRGDFSPIKRGDYEWASDEYDGYREVVEALIEQHYERSGAAEYFGKLITELRSSGEETK